ncbi:MAG: hypothetical protein E7385_02200 [Ruminococcaceae bacterium]|nr:hypothetical protein [Oscillospiraceae bacterium]
MKKIIVWIVLSVVLVMSMGINIQAEETEETEKLEWVNILDREFPEVEDTSWGHARFEDEVIYMYMWQDQPYQFRVLLDGLEPKFRMTGKIVLEEVTYTGEDDISGWNGLRIICGSQDFLNYNTVSLYARHGAHIVNHSSVGVGPLVPYPEGFAFAAGTEFTFELYRDGRYIMFKINDTVMIDYTISESEDFYNQDVYNNIGFIAINTAYQVEDLKIEVEQVVPDETPIPTEAPATPTVAPTIAPTEAPATEAPVTEAPGNTQNNNETDNYTWVWIVAGVAAVAVIACVVVVLNKNKKGK